jgi:hypothetical protein
MTASIRVFMHQRVAPGQNHRLILSGPGALLQRAALWTGQPMRPAKR